MNYKDLPLFNDLLISFNMSENELLEYFKNSKYEKMLEISLNINNIKLTNEEIIGYINFIDFTQSTYTDIAKHINVDNFNDINIEYNNNIKNELMLSLNFEIIDKFYSEKDKNIWLEYNFKYMLENNPDILKKYLEFSNKCDYYLLNGKILPSKKLYLCPSYNDLKIAVSKNKLYIVKYLIENYKFTNIFDILELVDDSNYESINFIIDYLIINKIKFENFKFGFRKLIYKGHYKIINIFVENDQIKVFAEIISLINYYSEIENCKDSKYIMFPHINAIDRENINKFIKLIINNKLYEKYNFNFSFETTICKSNLTDLIIYLCVKSILENNDPILILIFQYSIRYFNYDIINYYLKNNLINDKMKERAGYFFYNTPLEYGKDFKDYLRDNNILYM